MFPHRQFSGRRKAAGGKQNLETWPRRGKRGVSERKSRNVSGHSFVITQHRTNPHRTSCYSVSSGSGWSHLQGPETSPDVPIAFLSLHFHWNKHGSQETWGTSPGSICNNYAFPLRAWKLWCCFAAALPLKWKTSSWSRKVSSLTELWRFQTRAAEASASICSRVQPETQTSAPAVRPILIRV